MPIDENSINKPKKAVVDGNLVEAHPLKEQIEAEKFLASKKRKGSGVRFIKLRRGNIT